MRLTCVLATRGRPDLLRATLEETFAHVAKVDTRILVAADADDDATVQMLLGSESAFPGLVVSIRHREDDIGSKYNRALTEAPADVYMHMVDYAPAVSPGFDRKVLAAAALWPDNIGLVCTHLANASFPAAQCITAGLAAQLGYIFPPYFPYWFIDHWMDDIARLIGRIGFADVHVDCSRRPGTQNMCEPAFWGTFFDVLAPLRRRIAAGIIASDAYQAIPLENAREIARSSYPLVEYRSKWVNDHVRQIAAQTPEQALSGGEPDERYGRLKGRALAMLKTAIAELEAEASTAAAA